MSKHIELASETGFCFGVNRAIEILENKVKIYGKIESLGAVVHNDQVMQDLAQKGISVIKDINELKGNVIAISAHGLSPQIEKELKNKKLEVIDTTCPFVKRAQITARRLTEAGFGVVVYGDSLHTEVKGILGWANNQGIATLDANELKNSKENLRRFGILSQTTQIPEKYTAFVKEILDFALNKDAEIRVMDTICHDIRTRQTVSVELAKKVDLMFVIGGNTSANTRRLFELCSECASSYLIESYEDINQSWLKPGMRIGVTSGTSTSNKTIQKVVNYLKSKELN
jgi:4-hydroxy-3-methylbut-2-en-1-yl diphosphate reductase